MTNKSLRISALAESAGLSVRMLHHYDQIGLVRTSERTEAGHRRYSEADVRRLYQVVALRYLGVPLAGIASALEGDGFTLKDAVTAQLEAVDAELLHARRLRRRLERILEVLERSDDPSVSELTQIMEVMRCTRRTTRPNSSRISGQMKAHRDDGTDPSDPEVRALAERWGDLTERTIGGFTGRDPGITESLGRMYEEEGPEKACRGTFEADLLKYATRA